MKNKNMHKLDKIYFIGTVAIAMISGILDAISAQKTNFPVYILFTCYFSYIFWIVLFIYSIIKYKNTEDKPESIRWYNFFTIPFIHVLIAFGSMIPTMWILQLFK